MAEPSGTWFTSSRLDRLVLVLRHIPSRRNIDRLSRASAHRLLFPVVGVDSQEIRTCVSVLELLNLARGSDFLTRTVDGDRVVRALRNGDATLLPLAVLRSGYLSAQVQHLMSIARHHDDDLIFDAWRMRPAGAQLLGLMSKLSDFIEGDPCRATGALRVDLESAWTLRPVPGPSASDTVPRTEVGNRAELFSMQLELTRFVGAAINVRWVSQEDSEAGYDIEVSDGTRIRRIEVKGSQAGSVSFILSANEWEMAERYGRDYEVHFWGGIRLEERSEIGYERLSTSGFPVVIEDPFRVFRDEPWTIRPQAWRVRREESREGL